MTDARPAPHWSPEEAEAWLRSLKPREMRLGLERVRQALARLHHPESGLRVVTVAGTNGKGSTAAFLGSIGHVAGYRVGLYTSPHLVHVTERIQVGGTAILPEEFARWCARIRDLVEGRDGGEPIPLTYFEALTVMAIDYFGAREVDLAILEVGLGGRLDATAAVPPEVAILTSIGRDHEAFLGDTLEAIATEKAGIIQQGSTVVTGVDESLFKQVIGPRAFDLRCPIRRSAVDFRYGWLHGAFRYRGWMNRLGPVELGLAGAHQADNAALACAAAETLGDHGFRFKPVHLAEGLRRARHPGRFERREAQVCPSSGLWPTLLLDGSHNPLASSCLGDQLEDHLPEQPRTLLFAARHDKDIAGILEPLVPLVDAVVVTNLDEDAPLPLGPIAGLCRRYGLELELEPHLPAALERARRRALPGGGLLITGSLYLLGEVLPRLPEPRPELAH